MRGTIIIFTRTSITVDYCNILWRYTMRGLAGDCAALELLPATCDFCLSTILHNCIHTTSHWLACSSDNAKARFPLPE